MHKRWRLHKPQDVHPAKDAECVSVLERDITLPWLQQGWKAWCEEIWVSQRRWWCDVKFDGRCISRQFQNDGD